MNTAARSFYQAHGVASVEPAYEKAITRSRIHVLQTLPALQRRAGVLHQRDPVPITGNPTIW